MTRHCEECKHLSWNEWSEAPPTCAKGHRPRFYKPKSEVDTDFGYKRRCGDFEPLDIEEEDVSNDR